MLDGNTEPSSSTAPNTTVVLVVVRNDGSLNGNQFGHGLRSWYGHGGRNGLKHGYDGRFGLSYGLAFKSF